MTARVRPRAVHTTSLAVRARWWGRGAIGLATVGAGVVVVGWIVGIRSMAAPITGGEAVKFNLAVMFLALGAAFLLASAERLPFRGRVWVGGVVGVVATATLAEWVVDVSLGIDELLVADRWPTVGEPGGRAAPLVLVVVALLAASLLAGSRLTRTRDLLIVAANAVATTTVLGHAFRVQAIVESSDDYAVPVASGIIAMLLAIGVVLSTPGSGWFGWLFDPMSHTGALARRTVALAVVIPLLGGVGYRTAVDDVGLDDATAAWLVTMVATGVALLSVLLFSAKIERLSAKFSVFLDTIPEGVYETTFGGDLLLANEPLATSLGYPSAAEIVEQVDDVTRFWAEPAQRSALVAEIAAGRPSGRLDAELRRRDGSTFLAELSFQAVVGLDGRPTGLRGTIRDVTVERRLRDEASEADERFRLAFDTGTLGRAVIDLRDASPRFASVNEQLASMLGYTAAEMLDLAPESFVAPDDLPAEHALLQAHSSQPGDLFAFDTRRRHRDGSWVPVHVSGGVVFANGDGPRYAVLAVEDLRPRLEAEQQLDRSRQVLRNFVENVPSAVYLLDRSGRFLLVNHELERIIGVSSSEVLGRRRSEIPAFGDSGAEHRRNDLLVMKSGAQTLEERFGEGAETRYFLSTKFPLVDADGDVFGIGGVSTDITELRRLRAEADRAWAETTRRLASAVDYRDEETGAHDDRMAAYCELIARHLDAEELDPALLRSMATLHDAGKIAIPDAILLKPDTLTAAERAVMERHTTVGFELLCGTGNPDLDLAASIAHTHHERWDGTGYPRGLRGLDIPLEGRIAAIADVFDALTSDRVYRRAFDVEDAVGIMTEGSGSAFDPELLAVFLAHLDEAVAIRTSYAGRQDGEPVLATVQAPTA